MSSFSRCNIIKDNKLLMPPGNAICYSGYREGQSPQTEEFPSYDDVYADLQILAANWRYLRLYDCSQHALTVLQVITDHNLDFKLMLGVDLGAEVNNPNCPWGADYPESQLQENKQANQIEITRLINLCNTYPNLIFAASIGNEASVDWNDHMVTVESLVDYATQVKTNIDQPVTFCENYVPWLDKLKPLVDVVDFISVHTYPVWEYHTLESALSYTQSNYYSVAESNPNKPVIITEAGWTTQSNGRGIEPWNASIQLQAAYCKQLDRWTKEANILTFMFEAFDEPWKGSDDPSEPEKHWGFYYLDRTPKLVVKEIISKC
jgi:exo-beta-1,3-glucanase (GH17 family)